jgi:hypothetical protein
MSYKSEVFLTTLGEDCLSVGTYLQSEYGNAYEIVTIWPSIGGTTDKRFTLRHLQSDEEFTWNYNEMRYHRLKTLNPEDLPLLLLRSA